MKTATDLWINEPFPYGLTHRQRDILLLILGGNTNREIADMLQLSVRTVEVHRFNLMRRLSVRNVAQLFRRALQLGLLAVSQRLSPIDSLTSEAKDCCSEEWSRCEETRP